MYREFWQLFVTEYGGLRKLLLISVVTVGTAMLEGINIGLVVPLLETLGSPGQGETHWITSAVISVFEMVGIPFNLEMMLLVFVSLIGSLAVLKYLRKIWVAQAHLRFTVWTRDRAMRNFMQADLSYFHQERLGMLTDTYLSQCNAAGSCFLFAIEILGNLGIVVAYIVAAILLSPLLTVISLLTLVLSSLAVQYHIFRAKKIGISLVNRSIALNTGVLETLSGIQVVKSFLLERSRGDEMAGRAEAVRGAQYLETRNQAQTAIIQEMSVFTLFGGILYVGVSVIGLDFALITALLFVLYRLAPRVAAVNDFRGGLAASLAGLHQVKTVLDETTSPTITSGDIPFNRLNNGIEFKNVHFSYNGGPPVLHDTRFTIEAGKMTAIVGPSGAGKSTLTDLIFRHYDPSQGSISIDAVDLRDLDLASWRKSIGVVSQDVFLFNDTIENNICLGRPDVTQDDVVAAACQAYAHEFIQQLPDGYDTYVGDRGWNLSGGQQQRIALARAILEQPEILILDEATSSLDSESERLFQNYVNDIRGTRTIVVVAHRLSTIQNADKIIVLEDGQIVEEGDWDSLLDEAGIFANYYQLQSDI